MRKRRLYQQNRKPKSYVPTIAAMCVALFFVLYFGKGMSHEIAGFFAPSVPVADDIARMPPESSDGIDDLRENDADAQNSDARGAGVKHPRCGTILAGAAKNAAQNLLNIIAKGTRP